MPFPKWMAFALSAYEAAVLAEEIGQVVVFGAQEAISSSASWIPYIGAGVAGALPAAAFAYSQMPARSSRRRRRSNGSPPSRNVRRRLDFNPPRRGIQSRNIRIGGIMGREIKWTDKQHNASSLINTWGLIGGELTGVAQGTQRFERIGKSCSPQYLYIQGQVFFDNNSTQDWARLAVVWDKQVNMTSPAPAEVYTQLVNGVGLVDAGNRWNVYRDLEWTQRYTILKDLIITNRTGGLNEDGGGGVEHRPRSNVPFAFYIKLPNKYVTNYSGTGGTIADIVDNSLHLMGTSTQNTTLVRYISRVKYYG